MVTKVKIEADRCCGAGLCVRIAPHVFRVDTTGYNVSDGDVVSPSDKEAAKAGAAACPEAAIAIVETDQ